MILEILRHTPAWVFVLFGVLVAAGLRLARPSRVSLLRLCIVPLAMTAVLLSSLVQGFGAASAATAAWAVVVAIAMARGSRPPRAPTCNTRPRPVLRDSRQLASAGPDDGHLLNRCRRRPPRDKPRWHGNIAFAAVVGALYGVTSGAFVWRTLRIGRAAAAAAPAAA